MDGNSQPRPYFLPDNLALEDLPQSVQAAFAEIVQNGYDELVIQAPTALERAAGASFVFSAMLKVLGEVELGQEIAENVEKGTKRLLPREETLKQCIRAASAMQMAGSFILRVKAHRAKHEQPPFEFPPEG